MKWLIIGVLRAYQTVISPMYGPVCRYHPSCSHYALQAVRRYGTFRGGWLAVRRVVRCNPWSFGGYDPVPGTGTDPEPQDGDVHDRPDAPQGRTGVRDDGDLARESAGTAPTREVTP